MTSRQFNLHDGKKGAALTIRVTPRARKNEIVEILDDGTVKVRLTAAPGEGKTNQTLVEFLAGVLEIPASKVEVIAGEVGHDKLVTIIDLDPVEVHDRILKKMS